MMDNPQVILFSEEAKEAMRKQKIAHFSQEEIDAIGDTRTPEELAAYKESLADLGRELFGLGKEVRIFPSSTSPTLLASFDKNGKQTFPPVIRQTRIKELVCLLQGSVEGCIEFCYHPSLDRILERVMELKKEIEKIDD